MKLSLKILILLIKWIVIFFLICLVILTGLCYSLSKATDGFFPNPFDVIKHSVNSAVEDRASNAKLKPKFDALEKRVLQANPDPEELLIYARIIRTEHMRDKFDISLSEEESEKLYKQYVKKARELKSPTLLAQDSLAMLSRLANKQKRIDDSTLDKKSNQLISVLKNQCLIYDFYRVTFPAEKIRIYTGWYHSLPKNIENHPDSHDKLDAIYLRIKYECDNSKNQLEHFANKQLTPKALEYLKPPWQTELRQKAVYSALAQLMNMKELETKINNDVAKTNKARFEKQKTSLLQTYQDLFPNPPKDRSKNRS